MLIIKRQVLNCSSLYFIIFMMGWSFVAKAIPDSDPAVTIVTENYPPYQFGTSDNDISGIRTEFVQTVLKSTSLNYQLKMLPWARAYKTTLEKPNTCLFSIIYNKERDDKFVWIDTIGSVQGGFFTTQRRSKELHIDKLSDLHAYTIAVPRDGIAQLILESKGFSKEKELVLVNDWQLAIDMVVKGRVDFMVTNELVISYQLEQMHRPKRALTKVFTIKEFQSNHHYLACNLGTSPSVVKELRQAIKRIKKTNLQQLLRERWLN